MKKGMRYLAILSVIALLLSGQGGAVTAARFDTLDASTAVAGSSVFLRIFYETHRNADEKLKELLTKDEDPEESTGETEEESFTETEPGDLYELILYDTPRIGIVNTPGFLNIRSEFTTDSEVVGQALRGEEVSAVGEVFVDGHYWYKISRQEAHGFVHGDFLLFGDEAEKLLAEIAAEAAAGDDPLAMPEHFDVLDDVSGLSAQNKTALDHAVRSLNYSLKNDYPPANESGNHLHMYSILVYLLELYQQVADLAHVNGLARTLNAANEGIKLVESRREYLSRLTGQTEEEFFAKLASQNQAAQAAAEEQRQREEAARRAEEERKRQEEAARIAAEAAKAAAEEAERKRLEEEAAAARAAAEEAERKRQEEAAAAQQAALAAQQAANQALADRIAAARQEGAGTLGREMADFAATFVGTLPYIWGGASLVSGADCSGFVGQVLAHYGLVDQGKANWHAYCSYHFPTMGREVALSDIQPGDIICYSGHVAIYFGGGLAVHEPSPNHFCSYGSYDMLPILTIRRFQ